MLYESIEHRTELKLSRHLPNCTMFDLSGTSFSFFPIIESKISEQASRQVATEEPNKGEFCGAVIPSDLHVPVNSAVVNSKTLALNSLFSTLSCEKTRVFFMSHNSAEVH